MRDPALDGAVAAVAARSVQVLGDGPGERVCGEVSRPCMEERPCEDMGRQRRSTRQGEKFQEKPMLSASSSRTSNLQNCQDMTFFYLNPYEKF